MHVVKIGCWYSSCGFVVVVVIGSPVMCVVSWVVGGVAVEMTVILRFISVVSVGSMFRSTLRTMCFSICSEVVKVSLMIRVRLVIPFVVVE